MQDIPTVIPVAPNARWPEGLIIRAICPDDTEALTAMQSLPGVRNGTLRPPYPVAQSVRKHIETLPANVVSLAAIMDVG